MASFSAFLSKHKATFAVIAIFIALMFLGELFLNYISLDAVFAQAPIVARTIFFFIIVLEVIIAPIPGGIIGYLGAVHFGFWHAWGLMYVANVIGTITVFYLARHLGRPFVQKHTSQTQRERYDHLLTKYPWMLYVVYAVPLFPIDVISILAGVSTVEPKRFLLTACLGLVSYTALVALVGAFFGDMIPFVENLTLAAVGLVLLGCGWALWSMNKEHKKRNKK